MSCDHPPHRLYTGWYKGYGIGKSHKQAIADHLWVNCLECGESVKAPELALREEAEWEAQKAKRKQ